MTLTVGTTVVIGRTRIGTITRVGRNGGAPGYWIAAATGDPGARGGLSSFAAEHSVRPAIVGDNVCPTPRGGCFCGSAHVTNPDALPRAAGAHLTA